MAKVDLVVTIKAESKHTAASMALLGEKLRATAQAIAATSGVSMESAARSLMMLSRISPGVVPPEAIAGTWGGAELYRFEANKWEKLTEDIVTETVPDPEPLPARRRFSLHEDV